MDIAILLILIILVGVGYYSVRHRGERLGRQSGRRTPAMYQGRIKPSAIVPTSPPVVPMPLSAEVEDQLRQLDELKAHGAVDDTEYQARRERILKGI